VHENVSHVDIFPTVCEALGLKSPKHIQGESLLPLAKGKGRLDATIYFESMTPNLTAGWAPLRGFIRGDMKFIDLPIKEVYDLKRDVAEEFNLASKSDVTRLEKDLKKLQKKLRGDVVEQNLDDVEQDMISKMRTLGYITAGKAKGQKKYGPKDDLKSLLPLQIKMLTAIKDFREGRHDQALQNLKEVITTRPDYIPAYSHMSNLFFSLGIKEQAVQSLRDGLKTNRNSLYLQARLGLMLVEVQEYEEAIKLLKKCIAKEDNNPDYFIYLGVAQQKSGRFELALANYQEALKLDKSNSLIYNNIGSVHLMYFLRSQDLNQYRLAVSNFNNSLAFNPFLQAAINGREAAEKFKSQLEERNSVKY
jgi:tetratricopeptide (TPR) repeat protein